MIKKLSNEIVDMKRSVGEGNQNQRHYKPFFKINPSFKSIEPPLYNLNIDLGNIAFDSFCMYHQENDLERDCPQWVHAKNIMENWFLYEFFLTKQPSSSTVNSIDQEIQEPSEEIAMLLWDSNHLIPFNDIVEVQGPPDEVLVVQTWVKTQPVQINLTTTQLSRESPTTNHPKPLFSSQKNPTNIHTQEDPKLEYNVLEYLKKMKANVSVMDMCRIPQQKDFLLQALKSIDTPMTRTNQSEVPYPTDLRKGPSVNACSLDKSGRPFVPPFLLMFEVFNRNLHNCLVDLGASSNFMPLSICKKLNATPLKSDNHAIQLDRNQVKVIGELKVFMIRIDTHPKLLEVIYIILVDILEAYGMLLSRDWSEKLKGYFSIDRAHLWLPLKGHTNMIEDWHRKISQTYSHRFRDSKWTLVDRVT
jgi:hypothetical protein